MDTDAVERWRRVDRLFEAVLDRPPPDRGAFLDRECAEDPGLKREIEKLLEADARASDFLDDPSPWIGRMLSAELDAASDPVGRTVSHYEILEQLGRGGMGVVFKARDIRLDRTVTLKFLRPHLVADAEARARFIQEAKAASALDHSNICTVFEIDEAEDGQLFIAMAYYGGETLKDRIARGPVPVDQGIDIAAQVAEGMARAHDAGIVHRDLKPGNVILTDQGEVKILDFGIAKLKGATDLTAEGARIGTASYMSPEQARSEAVDHRTDVWSLGCLLYELLTGTRAFGGDRDAAVVHAILNEEPTALREGHQAIPQKLEPVVRRALALGQAIREYEIAVGLDSSFTHALARIGYVYAVILEFGWSFGALLPDSLLARGFAAVDRALAVDPGTPDAWMAQAYLLTHRNPRTFDGVADAFQRAIELDPRNAETYHQYGS